jgi:predicted nucleotidyltransferase
MKNDDLVTAVRDLAMKTNGNIGEANWYLFGSVQHGSSSPSDIDLLVVCRTNEMADAVRRSVDLDQLARPIHLSIFTQAEEAEVRFVDRQGCVKLI